MRGGWQRLATHLDFDRGRTKGMRPSVREEGTVPHFSVTCRSEGDLGLEWEGGTRGYEISSSLFVCHCFMTVHTLTCFSYWPFCLWVFVKVTSSFSGEEERSVQLEGVTESSLSG